MATIRVATAKSGLEVGGHHFGRSRDFNVYIDGTKAGTIPNGQKESFVVAAGPHTIAVKTDMGGRSHEHSLDLKENDSKAFHVQPSQNRIWLVAALVCSLLLHFILKATKASGYFYLLLLLPLSIYALAVWRKPWLTLTEI